jgi:hypothetical protein
VVTSPLPNDRTWLRAYAPHLLSAGAGITYGVGARLVFGGLGDTFKAIFSVMSVSFLFAVPLGIGVVYAVSLPR